MKKRILAMVLSAAMMVSLFPLGIFAEDPVQEQPSQQVQQQAAVDEPTAAQNSGNDFAADSAAEASASQDTKSTADSQISDTLPPPERVAEQKPAASENSQPADAAAGSEQPAVCICTEPCSEDSQNAECPVCSSDPALCKAKGEQSEPAASDTEPAKTQQVDTEASKAKPTLLEAEDEGLLPAAEEAENPAAKIGEKAYATLADAITAAQDGNTIILQRDLTESVTIEGKQNLTLNLNGKTLTGKEENAPVIAVNSSNNLTVTGGTITGGTNGGIHIENSKDATIDSCTIQDNKTTGVSKNGTDVSLGAGGGVYVRDSALAIKASTIQGNTATRGGGVYADHSTVNINKSTLQNNKADDVPSDAPASNKGVGGGIYSFDCTLTITDSTITGNEACGHVGLLKYKSSGRLWSSAFGKGGGGICAVGKDSNVTLSGVTVTDNKATFSQNNTLAVGGGINAQGGTLTVKESNISGNHARGNGGGISSEESNVLNISDSIIQSNQGNNGGGIHVGERFETSEPSQATITGTQILENASTGSQGGGVCIGTRATAALTNCIVAGNKTTSMGGGICGSLCAITLDNVQVESNAVTGNNGMGGGVFLQGNQNGESSLTLKNGTAIQNNSAVGFGGGIYLWGKISLRSDGTEDRKVSIANNTAANGGGIFATTWILSNVPNNPDLALTNTDILNNSATNGGGMYLLNSGNATIQAELQNSSIDGNKATGWGGGIFAYAGATITANHTSISKNTAANAGGLLLWNNCSAALSNDSEVCGNTATDGGAGVYLLTNSTLTMQNSSANGNTAATNGGGIYSSDGSMVTVSGSTLAENTAKSGGGIYLDKSSAVLTGNKIQDNKAANGSGGGIYTYSESDTPVTIQMTDNTISRNYAKSTGGGMAIANKNQAVTLTGGTISENEAASYGGGIHLSSDSSLSANGTKISGNKAKLGGGIYLASKKPLTLENVQLVENEANSGAGIYAYNSKNALTVGTGTLISRNKANNNGGGIFIGASSTPCMAEGAVYNNHAGNAGDDLFLNKTAGISVLRAVGTDWVLDDCSHNIDGWYLDGKDARWNADTANAETYYVTTLEKQVDGTAVVKNDDGSYTLTGAIALKAAHGLSGYTVRYLEKDTNKELHEAKQVENQPLGTEVKESAVDISGYDQVAPTQVSITISADSEKNVITFYYTLHRSSGGHTSTPEPDPDPTPTPTPVPPVVVPSTPAPTTPVRRITPAAQPTPAPTAAPTAQPADSQPAKAESEPEVIEADETPLAPMAGGAWALVNLILMLLTVLASLLLLIGYLGKKKYAKEDEYGNALHDANGNEIIDYTRNKKGFWRVASLIPAVAAVIAFVLTENMRLPMIMVDRWTLLMVIIAVVQLIVAVLCKKKKEYEEDEDEANI